MVNLVRPMIGSGTWKESGCMTKNVERKNNIKVAMAKPLISDIGGRIRIQGKQWENQSFYTFAFVLFGLALVY